MGIKLKTTLIITPTINEIGIIQRNDILTENNSCEKLTMIAAIPLKSVPMNVAVGFATRTNIAIKNGTNKGATSKLTVLYDNSNKFPFILPITKLNKTMRMPIKMEIIVASFIFLASEIVLF